MTTKTNTPPVPSVPAPDETNVSEAQQSAVHGFWEDDALKRIIKQHPQKGIPQVEGLEPAEAPPKE